MARRKTRPYNENQQRIIDLVVQWRSTPEPLRTHKTLREYAIANGIKPGTAFYQLASSPDVYHQLLVGVAGNAIAETPDILSALADKARSGHVRAAEVFLDFVRKTITDEGMIRALRPTHSVEGLLEEVKGATIELLTFVRGLPPTEEEARAALQEMAEDTPFIEDLLNGEAAKNLRLQTRPATSPEEGQDSKALAGDPPATPTLAVQPHEPAHPPLEVDGEYLQLATTQVPPAGRQTVVPHKQPQQEAVDTPIADNDI